jgi:NAD(P)-dependent dehydrogenase (short-subunit alcohol dehydrogenase family)
MTTALITGASAGLGRALARALAVRGWQLVIDARGERALVETAAELSSSTRAVAVPGDLTDPAHRTALADAVRVLADGEGLDLLVHNASTLGPTGLHPLADTDEAELRLILETNLVAPLALTRILLPDLRRARGTVLTISSDAAVAHYPTWGGYGASKAALDHLAGTLAAEHPELTVHAVDPGDMRTAMHQAAFPGEDIGDRPLPETVVPHLLGLLDVPRASGRCRATDVAAGGATR